MNRKIYHITTQEAWDEAKLNGKLFNDSLEKEGFIHCSYSHQLLSVANALFKGKRKLLIIGIFKNKLNVPVIDEDLYKLDELYPHVYGSIPVNSVFGIYPFYCDDEGSFSLPENIVV